MSDLIPVRARGKHLIVDIHAHLGVPAADAMLRAAMPGFSPAMPFSSPDSSCVTGKMLGAIAGRLNGVADRIADMDLLGIDVQALSPNPGQYFYFTEPALGAALAQTINDGVAEAVAMHPDRLVGLGTVPLQSPEHAIAEMRRCVRDLGLRGIEISTNVNGRELSDPGLRPFLAAAQDLDVLLFIHPLGFSHGERLSEHYLNNILGNPIESTIAVSHLIFSGRLRELPRLKICVAHGGGYLPAYWGRMDHAWRARPDCRRHIDQPPSSYLRRLWLDTLVFDPVELAALVEAHGADRLCLGTDYPFDMSEPDPVAFHAGLSPDAFGKIVGGNAADLLGLRVAECECHASVCATCESVKNR